MGEGRGGGKRKGEEGSAWTGVYTRSGYPAWEPTVDGMLSPCTAATLEGQGIKPLPLGPEGLISGQPQQGGHIDQEPGREACLYLATRGYPQDCGT